MAKKYLVTFDLANGSEGDYQRIYGWAYSIGGYRYFPFRDGSGTWGRLASTTITVPLNVANADAARDQFRELMMKAALSPTHIAVTDGDNPSLWSQRLQANQVPEYAKQGVNAGV